MVRGTCIHQSASITKIWWCGYAHDIVKPTGYVVGKNAAFSHRNTKRNQCTSWAFNFWSLATAITKLDTLLHIKYRCTSRCPLFVTGVHPFETRNQCINQLHHFCINFHFPCVSRSLLAKSPNLWLGKFGLNQCKTDGPVGWGTSSNVMTSLKATKERPEWISGSKPIRQKMNISTQSIIPVWCNFDVACIVWHYNL